jgi:hypothetical protein
MLSILLWLPQNGRERRACHSSLPGGAAPPPRTRSFWARPGAGAKRLDSSPLGPLTTKSTSRPRTLEEPARFAVRWHFRPGSLMTGLRSRSPPTESPSPVLSLGGYLRPARTPLRSWCPARAYDRALELREHPSIWRSALPGASSCAKDNYIAFLKQLCYVFICGQGNIRIPRRRRS